MAGDPAPLAAVQAAVMKSSAAAQGQAEPAAPAGAFQGAIAQDLAVMADQAKGYSAGAAAGNVEAENQRGAASSRMALEASQAAAARQRQIEMAKMDTDQARLRLAAEQQEGQIRLRDQARAAQEAQRQAREERSGGSSEDRKLEKLDETRRQILHRAKVDVSPTFSTAIDSLLAEAGSYREFQELFDVYARELPDFAAAVPDRDLALRYGKTFYDAAAGKRTNLSRDLTPPKRKPFLTRAVEEAARRSGGTAPDWAVEAMRNL